MNIFSELLFMANLLLNSSVEFLTPNYCIGFCFNVFTVALLISLLNTKEGKGKLQVGETISING